MRKKVFRLVAIAVLIVAAGLLTLVYAGEMVKKGSGATPTSTSSMCGQSNSCIKDTCCKMGDTTCKHEACSEDCAKACSGDCSKACSENCTKACSENCSKACNGD